MIAAAVAAFLAVFVAEFGDKSQLVTLTMACRYPPLQVLAGAMLAFAVVVGLAVGVGGIVASYVPHTLVAILSGVFFVAVGIFTYYRKKEHDEVCEGKAGFFQTLTMIFLAEFGDKTQLAAMFLAASLGYPLAIFAGAMLALLINHILAIYLGSQFIARLDPRYIRIGSALLFVAIGLFMIIFETGIGF